MISLKDISEKIDSIELVFIKFLKQTLNPSDKTSIVNIYPIMEDIRKDAILDLLCFYSRYGIDPVKGIDTLKIASFYLYHIIRQRVGRISGITDVSAEVAFQTIMFYIEEQCEEDRNITIELQTEAAEKAIKFLSNRAITSETIYFMFHMFRNTNTNSILPQKALGS